MSPEDSTEFFLMMRTDAMYITPSVISSKDRRAALDIAACLAT